MRKVENATNMEEKKQEKKVSPVRNTKEVSGGPGAHSQTYANDVDRKRDPSPGEVEWGKWQDS